MTSTLPMSETNTSPHPVPVAVAALMTGASALALTLLFAPAPSYPDFLVGNIAWTASAKTQDLLAWPVFIVVVSMTWLFLRRAMQVQHAAVGPSGTKAFAEQLLWWSLPGLTTLFGQMVSNNIDPQVLRQLGYDVGIDARLLHLSTLGIIYTGVVTWALAAKGRAVDIAAISLNAIGVLLIALLPFSIAMVLSRGPLRMASHLQDAPIFASVAAIAVILYCFAALNISRDPKRWLNRTPVVLLLGQLGLCTFYLCLYPSLLQQVDGSVVKYATSPWLIVLLLGVIGSAVADVVLRYRRHRHDGAVPQLLSPLALFALIVALKAGATLPPQVSPDDYHFGERVLGFWSMLHGQWPYLDYIPAHGMIDDDLAGLVANIFYDGSAGAIGEAARLSLALLGMATFIALRRFSGSIALACVALLFLDVKLSWCFLGLVLALWFDPGLRARPARWLTVWLASVPVILLAVPAQGLLLIVASGVLVAHMCWQLWRAAKPVAWWPPGMMLAVLIVLGVSTPLFAMLWAALRYVLENGPINPLTYGVPWSASWTDDSRGSFVVDSVRMSWVAAILTCLAVLYTHRHKRAMLHDAVLPTCVVLLFLVLMIPYAMGRIDSFGVSRAGLVSALAWMLLIPFAIWHSLTPQRRVALVFAICFVGSALYLVPTTLARLGTAYAQTIPVAMLKDGPRAGFAAIGHSVVDDAHWARLVRLRSVLDAHLKPGETYFDATSRNAQYIYLNRLPPVEISAVYNMAPPAQQTRAMTALQATPPRFALLEADNIIFDGGGLALRTPVLHRFLVGHYTPVFEDGFIIGIVNSPRAAQNDAGIDLALNPVNDPTWSNGIHRSIAAIRIADPDAAATIAVGDHVAMPDGSVRAIAAVDPGAGVLQFEGAALNPTMFSGAARIRWLAGSRARNEYRMALFDRAFIRKDLQMLPVAWGRSAKTLHARMTKMRQLGIGHSSLHQLVRNPDGSYRPTGNDPALIFALPGPAMSGRQAGLLEFDFTCVGRREMPRLQVFWWGDSRDSGFEASSVHFTADNGRQIVPLDASAYWLLLHRVAGLRIDLNNASACDAIRIDRVGLSQRHE